MFGFMHRTGPAIVLLLAATGLWFGASHHLLRMNLCHVGHYRWHVSAQPCGEPAERAGQD